MQLDIQFLDFDEAFDSASFLTVMQFCENCVCYLWCTVVYFELLRGTKFWSCNSDKVFIHIHVNKFCWPKFVSIYKKIVIANDGLKIYFWKTCCPAQS